MKMVLKSNKFNLVLSGGAALGFAHIGVIELLEELNLTPYSYHGVSMGAIVASLEALALPLNQRMKIYEDVFSSFKWIRLNFDGSLISTKKIEEILENIFKNMRIKDTKRELNIIATNYQNGKIEIFNSNSNILIKDAILASMAVPAIFPPKIIDQKIFVDGYLSSNLPLDSIDNEYLNLIVNVVGKNSFSKDDASTLASLSILKHLERTIRILIYNQTSLALKNFKKRYILIEPPLSNFKTYHFNRFYEIKNIGYLTAKKILTTN